MRDINLVKRNISKMIEQNAPESDIDEYVASEGYTPEMLRGEQPAQAQPKQERSTLGTVAKAVSSGVENIGLGLYQTAADLGHSFEGAKKVLSLIRPDLKEELMSMTSQDIGESLAQRVKQKKELEKDEGLLFNLTKGITEAAPYLATGGGTALKTTKALGGKALSRIAGLGAGGAVGGAVQEGLSAQEEAGLQNRLEETAKGGAYGAAFGAGLGALGEVAKPVLKATTSTVDRIRSELGSKKVAKKLATSQLKQGLAREGIDIAEALKQTSQEGKDLVDILDPRFATLNKGLRNLNRPETIKIADESLKRINQTTNKLQDEVLNLISNNKITPEQAGEILGRNSKKLFDKAIAARTAKVEPLYKEALEEGIKINPKTTTATGESLEDILKSPFMQKVLNEVRNRASEFVGTPASKYYGNIYEKTEDLTFRIPDNDIRVLYATEKALGDLLNNPQSITGITADQAAIKANKNAISKFLDEASPKLTMARKQYSKLSQEIKGEGKSLLGRYAKMYNEGRTDELTKAAMDILKLPPNRIIKAKQINPQEFNDLLRASFENKIASIQPLDDGVINPKEFTKAFFSDEGRALEAATGDKEIVKGFRRLAENLDIRFQRNRITKAAMESQAKSVRVPTGKSSAINRVLEFAEDRLVSSPAVQKEFVNGLFTPQGQEMLRTIANSEKKVQEQIINNFMRNIIYSNLSTKMVAE